MSNTLTILFQRIDKTLLLRNIGRTGNIFALSPSAMDMCEEMNVFYDTPDDYLVFSDHRKRTMELATDLSELCCSLDAKLKVPFSEISPYGVEMYILWLNLTSVLYLHDLSSKLSSKFESIDLVGAPHYQKMASQANFDLSSHDCFSVLGYGFQLAESVFAQIFAPNRYVYDDLRTTEKLHKCWANHLRPLLGRIKRFLFIRYKPLAATVQTNCSALFANQGYGLEYVLNSLPELRCDSIHDLCIPVPSPTTMIGEDGFKTQIGKFLDKWFPLYKDTLLTLFVSHREHIISSLPDYSRSIYSALQRLRPKFLCFSNGLFNHQSATFAREANRLGIPVFSLQHGGFHLHQEPELFYSVEAPLWSGAVLVYHGKLDDQRFHDLHTCRGGNITAFKLSHKTQDLPSQAIFIQGVCTFVSYRSAPCSDKASYLHHKDILTAFERCGAPLSIKAHVICELYNMRYFKSLISRFGRKHTRLLPSCTAEEVLFRYGLIVLENIGSLVSVLALGLDVPIILHDPVDEMIRPDIREALLNRVYLSRSSQELEQYVTLFKSKLLPAKGVEQAREDFLWPQHGPDPVTHLLTLFRDLCHDGVQTDC